MIMIEDEGLLWSVHPRFIYNNTVSVCQEQAAVPVCFKTVVNVILVGGPHT